MSPRVTRPLGLLLVAAVIAAGAEAVASLALFALAAGLALLVACSGLTVAVAAKRVNVARTVVEREVQEDAPVRIRFAVEGPRWLPVGVEAEDHAGGWLEVDAAGAVAELRVGRRGEYRLLPSRVRFRDPFGIFGLARRAGSAEPLLVLPAPLTHANLAPRHPAVNSDPEPDGLQEHIPGTPLARIHWPALARGAGLQARRFAAAPGGLPLVVVDTAGTPDPRAVDWAARTAAGHVLALTRSGGCRVVLPGDAGETTVIGVDAGWRVLHRRLARLRASLQSPPPRGSGDAILVRASQAPAALLRALPRPLPARVVPAAPDRREAIV